APIGMSRSSRTVATAAFIIVVLAPCLAAATPASSPTPAAAPTPAPTPLRNIGGPGDYALRQKLVSELSRNPLLQHERFSVVMVNGGAVFSGEISTCAIKQQILTTAAVTRGVINVTDQMSVRRAELPDAALQKAIADRLSQAAKGLGLEHPSVEVRDGVATLEGSVPDLGSRLQVEGIVGTVAGVRQILDHLQPRDAPAPADDASRTDAVVAYLGDFHHFAYPAEISVSSKDGVVVLEGRCALYLGSQQAALLASFVKGTTGVDNRIEVDPSLMRRGAAVQKRP
ncbi:MAG TPA: BON domain-containing protein, partial [Candidatus Polarisedimenticolia bacterium]|nr:BON domain-containing protein [Candidatus Polarisedimenticolia bacterium]